MKKRVKEICTLATLSDWEGSDALQRIVSSRSFPDQETLDELNVFGLIRKISSFNI